MSAIERSVSRRDLLFLMLGLDAGPSGFGGITRLQKLMFLLEQEGRVDSSAAFAFQPYKAGPYSATLYDDLEFLENLGYIQGEVSAEASVPEAAEVDRLSFDYLMGDDSPRVAYADTYEERRYILTTRGRERIETLKNAGRLDAVISKIRRIKSKYGRYSLNDLLYYVYTKYPEMTTESEIRNYILVRGSRK